MNTLPKYSTSPLPGDDWETRYTKAIVRNMIRVKEMQGFTTQRFVDRCNEFLGETDKVKLSSINGLFAGKRKTISTAELQMFASALDVPVLGLLYPPQSEDIEIRPGYKVSGEYGIRTAAGVWNYFDGESPVDLEKSLENRHDPISQGVFRVIDAFFIRWEFYDAMVRLYEAIEKGANDEVLGHIANATTLTVSRYKFARDQLRLLGVTPEKLPPPYAWIDTMEPHHFSKDVAKAHFDEFLKGREASIREEKESVRLDRKWLSELRESNG